MKGRQIRLDGVRTPKETMRRIVSVRFAEALSLAPALKAARAEPLHDFRIACKRLRYALELFGDAVKECRAAERSLVGLQQSLGDAHDCDILLHMARRCKASHLANRVKRDRERAVRRAQRLWQRSASDGGSFNSLILLTGIGTRKA